MTDDVDDRRKRARAWFESLRDRLCTAFEALEDRAPADLYGPLPGRFVRKAWDRPEGGGGVMAQSRSSASEVWISLCR